MSGKMVRSIEFWLGAVLVLAGALWIYGSQQIFVPRVMTGSVGPEVFPLLLGWIMLILGPLVWIRARLEGSEEAQLGSRTVLVMLLGASLVYLLLFEELGYILCTIPYTAALFYFLGERRHWLTAIISVGVTLLFYFGFADFLNVDLPVGPFGF